MNFESMAGKLTLLNYLISLYVNTLLIHLHTHEGQDRNLEPSTSICQYKIMLDQHGTVVNTRYLGFSKASDTESCSIFIWKHWDALMLVMNHSVSGS